MARLYIRRLVASCIIVKICLLVASLMYWSLNNQDKTRPRVVFNSEKGNGYIGSTVATFTSFPSNPWLPYSTVPPSADIKLLIQEPRVLQNQYEDDNSDFKSRAKTLQFPTRDTVPDPDAASLDSKTKNISTVASSANVKILRREPRQLRKQFEDSESDKKMINHDNNRSAITPGTEDASLDLKTKNVDLLNCSNADSALYPLLRDDGLVRHCVSHAVIGKVPRDLKTLSVRSVKGKVAETSPVRRQSFKQVFETRAWGQGWDAQYQGLNASGMGATLRWAQETIATLHTVVDQLKQRYGLSRVRLLDVPCGDMAWMSRFLVTRGDIDYTGVDIVPDLIQHHRVTFADRPWKFMLSDIVHDGINTSSGGYDLVLCRTLLQHLFFPDVLRVLGHLSVFGRASERPVYLLTTSFAVHPANDELVIDRDNPGRFRRLNMEIPPISLTPPLCMTRDGPPDAFEGWTHFIGLWKLPLKRVSKCWKPAAVTVPDVPNKLFSCVDWSIPST